MSCNVICVGLHRLFISFSGGQHYVALPEGNIAAQTDVSLITGSLRQMGSDDDTAAAAGGSQQLQLRNENKELMLASAADAGEHKHNYVAAPNVFMPTQMSFIRRISCKPILAWARAETRSNGSEEGGSRSKGDSHCVRRRVGTQHPEIVIFKLYEIFRIKHKVEFRRSFHLLFKEQK